MYAKLFSSILSSSLWSEDSDTCKVWITLLALADREGFVFGSPVGIARQANLPIEKTLVSLAILSRADPYSQDRKRDPESDGRRIEETEAGGWRLVNYAHYRDLADQDIRRAQFRESKRRTRKKTDVERVERPRKSTRVHTVHPSESSSESESSQNQGKREPQERASRAPRVPFTPPSVEEVRTFAAEKGLSLDPAYFVDAYGQKGWMAGKVPMRDWHAAARNAARDGWTTRNRGGATEPRVVIHKNQSDIDREREGDEIARNRAAATRAREEREGNENGWQTPDTPEERAESERLCKVREAQLAAEKARS